MFSYCRNNPASRTDLFGYADEDAKEKAGQNIENMLAFFGVDSPEELPEMSDDCMVSVSYTHLDVYKRQPPSQEFIPIQKGGPQRRSCPTTIHKKQREKLEDHYETYLVPAVFIPAAHL